MSTYNYEQLKLNKITYNSTNIHLRTTTRMREREKAGNRKKLHLYKLTLAEVFEMEKNFQV